MLEGEDPGNAVQSLNFEELNFSSFQPGISELNLEHFKETGEGPETKYDFVEDVLSDTRINFTE